MAKRKLESSDGASGAELARHHKPLRYLFLKDLAGNQLQADPKCNLTH